jgi:uncharacterized protein (DUF305 family)
MSPTTITEHDDDDVIVLSWWQNPVNVIALVLASLLIGAMVGWAIGLAGEDRADDDVSVGFLHDMRAHHEQAVLMSMVFLGVDGDEPGLRTVARTIVQGQSVEVGRMIQLLRDAGQPEAGSASSAMSWMDTDMGDMVMTQAQMPGMASDDDILAMGNATGADADEQFAALMIAHHQGGIDMASYAAEHAGSDEVRTMAAAIAHAQESEIAEIQGLLD